MLGCLHPSALQFEEDPSFLPINARPLSLRQQTDKYLAQRRPSAVDNVVLIFMGSNDVDTVRLSCRQPMRQGGDLCLFGQEDMIQTSLWYCTCKV